MKLTKANLDFLDDLFDKLTAMKTYHLYVFTQDNCAPCRKLKEHVATLTEDEQKELDFVPLKVKETCSTCAPDYTALAEELNVTQTPTLVVVHEEVSCLLDDGDDWCENKEVEVERFVGANAIIKHLDATLDAYTYSHPE